LQHCRSDWHVLPEDLHVGAVHSPLSHELLQQS
jgi:hypothetical protein